MGRLPIDLLQLEDGPQFVRYCIVGAGFSGAVIGRALAEAGHRVLVIDERAHVAGNCFSARDLETGIMVHVYGPHIFHTSDERVWAYVQKFGEMVPYQHRVQAIAGGAVYSLPINLLTINQFFGRVMNPTGGSRLHRQQVLADREPCQFRGAGPQHDRPGIVPCVLPRLHAQAVGVGSEAIAGVGAQAAASALQLRRQLFRPSPSSDAAAGVHGVGRGDSRGAESRIAPFDPLRGPRRGIRARVYSGPIDRFFSYAFGRLGYRTLDFEVFRAKGDFQGAAVLNYCDESTSFTRITEHKYFAPWERDGFEETICYREFSRQCGPTDIPYYPIRQTDENAMLRRYVERAQATCGVSFVGRLGSYRYLDMDVTIGEALAAADVMLAQISEGAKIPPFFVTP
jgi:UDP-galactopyranose mutase